MVTQYLYNLYIKTDVMMNKLIIDNCYVIFTVLNELPQMTFAIPNVKYIKQHF